MRGDVIYGAAVIYEDKDIYGNARRPRRGQSAMSSMTIKPQAYFA
jgi:hypothetical protein